MGMNAAGSRSRANVPGYKDWLGDVFMLEKFLPFACLGTGSTWPYAVGDALGSIRLWMGDHEIMTIMTDSEECDRTACTFTQRIRPEGALRQQGNLSCPLDFFFKSNSFIWLYAGVLNPI